MLDPPRQKAPEQPVVVPILATPFGVVSLPGAASLNPQLVDLFVQRSQAAGGHPSGNHGNPLCYQSPDDLLEWPDPSVRRLASGMLRGVCSMIETVNDLAIDQLRSFKPEARGWFTIVRPDGCLPAINFPLTAWCAVYCVAAPAASADRRDSGMLRLYESRLTTMFADATTAEMRLPYRAAHYGWLPAAGEMAIFPAALTHEIALLRAREALMLVTLRIRFVAPGQTGVGRW
jgi:hypothetical protein